SIIDSPRVIFYDDEKRYVEGKLFENSEIVDFTTGDFIHYIRLVAPIDVINSDNWILQHEDKQTSEYSRGFFIKDLSKNKRDAHLVNSELTNEDGFTNTSLGLNGNSYVSLPLNSANLDINAIEVFMRPYYENNSGIYDV